MMSRFLFENIQSGSNVFFNENHDTPLFGGRGEGHFKIDVKELPKNHKFQVLLTIGPVTQTYILQNPLFVIYDPQNV